MYGAARDSTSIRREAIKTFRAASIGDDSGSSSQTESAPEWTSSTPPATSLTVISRS